MILNVPIDCIRADEAVACIRRFLDEERFHHVATPNNEMLLAARKDPAFLALLQRTDLNLPDSTGVVWASRYTDHPIAERVTGVDTVTELCGTISSEHRVFFLGAGPGVAEKSAAFLRTKNPSLAVAGAFSLSPREEDSDVIIEAINASGAHVLLVAFGSPAQELWIDHYRSRLLSVRVAIGVGGTFDFLAGTRQRAPRLLQNLGLEWVFRLFQEPRRIKRIWNAVVVFPLVFLGSRTRV